ncbi:unnamed protein product [Bathycoccus prasinos]
MVTCCHALYYPVNSSKKMILYRRCKRKQKAKFSAFLKKRGPVSDLLSEITTEHESYANFLVQEYSLNAATNHEVAVRKLNEKFRVFGKDDEFFQVVFLAFRKLVENSAKLPNAHIVTTVITVAGKRGYLSEADFAFGWSQTSCDSKLVRPTAYTYTAYIQAIGQNVRGDSWVLAFDIFDDMIMRLFGQVYVVGKMALLLIPRMRENDIEPDLPVISALVSAFGAANNIDGVRSATHSALKFEKLDGRLFVDIICAFTSCRAYQEALDIFHSSKCPKNIQTCTAIMQAYINSGKVKDAEQIYNRMRIDRSEGGYGFLPNARAHTTMLNGYEKSLMSSSAVNLLRKLEQFNMVNNKEEFVPNEIHYNVVLSACGKCGEWSTAESIFHSMRARGVPTTTITFSTLITAYGRSGETFRARCLYNLMRKEGIFPDDYSFVGLILGHAVKHDLRAALDVRNLMASENISETIHTYNALIYAADICGDYEKVVSLYELMLRSNLEPNETTHELVVNVGKKGAKFYEETQLAANVASAAAGLVGVVGMALGRW